MPEATDEPKGIAIGTANKIGATVVLDAEEYHKIAMTQLYDTEAEQKSNQVTLTGTLTGIQGDIRCKGLATVYTIK